MSLNAKEIASIITAVIISGLSIKEAMSQSASGAHPEWIISGEEESKLPKKGGSWNKMKFRFHSEADKTIVVVGEGEEEREYSIDNQEDEDPKLDHLGAVVLELVQPDERGVKFISDKEGEGREINEVDIIKIYTMVTYTKLNNMGVEVHLESNGFDGYTYSPEVDPVVKVNIQSKVSEKDGASSMGIIDAWKAISDSDRSITTLLDNGVVDSITDKLVESIMAELIHKSVTDGKAREAETDSTKAPEPVATEKGKAKEGSQSR